MEGARGRSYEGTGIGLAMVRELARQHGVQCGRKRPRKGTFIVEIPLGTGHASKDRVSSGPVPETAGDAAPYLLEASRWGAPADGGPGVMAQGDASSVPLGESPLEGASAARILVADDNADMRAYLARLLAARWNVTAVEDGQAAFDAALRSPPDLVLSDVMMPRMDGIRLLQALRGDPRTASRSCCSHAHGESVVAGLGRADDYLVKPFSARRLITRPHAPGARPDALSSGLGRGAGGCARRLLADLGAEQGARRLQLLRVARLAGAAAQHKAGQCLESTPSLDDTGRRCGGSARRAERMALLIEGLLQLSRHERADLRRERGPVPLARQVGDALTELEPDRSVDFVVSDGLVAEVDRATLRDRAAEPRRQRMEFTSKTARRGSSSARSNRTERPCST